MNESLLHEQVCTYIKYQYPNAHYKSDHEAGRKRNFWEQNKIKLMASRGWPDIFIAEPYNSVFTDSSSLEIHKML